MEISRDSAEKMLKQLRSVKFGKTRNNGTKTRKAQNQDSAEQILLKITRGQQPSTEERRSIRNAIKNIKDKKNHNVTRRPIAQGKGQEHGPRFKYAHQVANYFTRKFTSPNSAPTSRTGSPESSRSSRSSRSNSNTNHNNTKIQMPALAASKRVYTKKVPTTPPISGKWPILKKGSQLWSVKIIPVSKSRINIMKIYGYEGTKLTTSTQSITSGKAGRSLSREAKHKAQENFNEKKADGYSETTNVHLGSNNEIKSINNFVAK